VSEQSPSSNVSAMLDKVRRLFCIDGERFSGQRFSMSRLCRSLSAEIQIIKPHEYKIAGREGFQAKDHHECFCSLRNHTSVVLYLSYATKTTENNLILEFHMPSSQWRYTDGATTSRRPVQQYAWRHRGSTTTLTQQWKSVLYICCIWYFYTMAQLPDFARKGIVVYVF
jgi:hypothetical protein